MNEGSCWMCSTNEVCVPTNEVGLMWTQVGCWDNQRDEQKTFKNAVLLFL